MIEKKEEIKSRLRRCPDCGVKAGEIHKDNCDVERCSVCGSQRLFDDCEGHDKTFSRWSGFWPGELEADALGIDLNDLYGYEIYKSLFIKPIDKNTESIQDEFPKNILGFPVVVTNDFPKEIKVDDQTGESIMMFGSLDDYGPKACLIKIDGEYYVKVKKISEE